MTVEPMAHLLEGNDLFISDIHLDGVHHARQAVLERFLELHARRARRLYILGDLFNVWFGRKQLGDGYVQRIMAAIAGVAAAGVEVHFLAGNRDFYGLKELGRAGAMITYPRSLTIDSFGQRVYLCHGHRLFKRDHSSHSAQSITKFPLIEILFQRLPLEMARTLALAYREQSKRVLCHKNKRVLCISDDVMLDKIGRAHV